MSKTSRTKLLWIVAGVIVIAAAFMMRSSVFVTKAADPAKAAPPPVAAVTTTVKEEDVPTYLSGIGSVTPLYSVVVKVRVDGQLEKVTFTEGQDIAAGTVLAQIDPRPLQAQLELAQATHARDTAQLKNSIMD